MYSLLQFEERKKQCLRVEMPTAQVTRVKKDVILNTISKHAPFSIAFCDGLVWLVPTVALNHSLTYRIKKFMSSKDKFQSQQITSFLHMLQI